MRRLTLGTVSLALVLCVNTSGAAPVPKHLMPKESGFAYPTAVGATWVYDIGNNQEETLTIGKVEDGKGEKLVTSEYVRAGVRSHHMTWSVRDTGVFLVSENGNTYAKPWCIFKLPHKEGDTWKTEGHGGDMRAGPVEKVKTLAGEIEACRVDWLIDPNRVVKFWYAPRIGLVATDGGIFHSLKSFTAGKE